MNNDSKDGIILQDMMPLEEEKAIDWDAVLRDFTRSLRKKAQANSTDNNSLFTTHAQSL